MTKKSGKMEAKGSTNKWRAVPVDLNLFEDEGMTGFAGLEEIAEYDTLHLSQSGKVLGKSVTKATNKSKVVRPSLDRKKSSILEKRKQKERKRKNPKKATCNTSYAGDTTKKPQRKRKRAAEDESATSTCKKQFKSDEEVSVKMQSWQGLFVPDPVLRALWELGFHSPTPIQALTLPSAIRDRMDILGAAQTGSGKTLAFGIPIINSILQKKETEQEKKLHALVLTPTRELAIQVKKHLESAAVHTSIKVAVVVGGMAPEKQRRILRKGPDIVVATPGRLWELYEEGEEHLQKIPDISHFVIDEADRITEKGHFSELENIVQLLKGNAESKYQTFVFSATLTMTHSAPRRLRLKKKKYLVTPSMKLESMMSYLGMQGKPKIIDLSPKAGTADTLSETRIYCETDQKDIYLYYFWLSHPGRTLVFCNSIDCVRRLQALLELLNCKPLCLHANMQQRQRLKNLDRFKARDECLLLASDVAARGLDISNVQHVVHYQVPRTAEIYVHRSGRTARAQKEGLSLMMISPEEGPLYKKMSRTLNRDGELPEFPVDHSLFTSLQERVSCASKLDKLVHHQNKSQAQNRWMKQAAEAFEVDIEEDYELSRMMKLNQQAGNQKHEIVVLRKKLQSLLNKKISPPGYFSSYPTQTGKLACLKAKSSGDAVSFFNSKRLKIKS